MRGSSACVRVHEESFMRVCVRVCAYACVCVDLMRTDTVQAGAELKEETEPQRRNASRAAKAAITSFREASHEDDDEEEEEEEEEEEAEEASDAYGMLSRRLVPSVG